VKVAIDCRRIIPEMTGLGTYTRELIRALIPLASTRGIELMLFTLPESAAALAAEAGGTDVRIVRHPVEDHLAGDWWKHFSLPKILDSESVDLFHDPAYQVPLRRSRARYITTVHDLSPFRFPESNTWKYNAYWTWMTRQAVRRSVRIITVSESVREELESMFPDCRGRVDVVYEAASPDFKPGIVGPDLFQRLRLKSPYFLTMAKYEPRKNLARCLAAFRMFKQRVSTDAMMVVAGAMGYKTGRIVRTVEDLTESGAVCFTGYLEQPELVDLIRGARAVLVPSLYEGFGLPVLEAMACGTPVACSDRGALVEIGGDAPLYFDPLDCTSMAAVMERFAGDSDLTERMRSRGLDRARSFSWERTALETLAAYQRARDSLP